MSELLTIYITLAYVLIFLVEARDDGFFTYGYFYLYFLMGDYLLTS